MAERDSCDHDHKFAIALPVEAVIDSRGEQHIHFAVGGTDEETLHKLVEGMKKELPGEIRDIDEDPICKVSSQFGFSDSRWNSPWKPKGPKRNWRTESPEDFSNN